MKKFKRLILLIACVLIPEVIGFLSSYFSGVNARSFYFNLNKPSLAPPGSVFGIVWVVLYAMMGYASYRIIVSKSSRKEKVKSISLYAIQLFFNFLWSIIFFGMMNYMLAFVNILLILTLVIFTAVEFYKIDKNSGFIMIPYIMWVSFATYLNWYIVLNN